MKPHKDQPVITAKPSAKTAAATLTAVGTLVAKRAELTKLSTVDLPNAYRDFGKEVYQQGRERDEFGNLFRALDLLRDQRQSILEQAEGRAAPVTFADRAKRAAVDAASLAKTKTIDLQADRAFAKLGEAVYGRHEASGTSESHAAAIANALERRAQIKQKMAAIEAASKGRWVTPYRLLGALGAILLLVVLWNVAGRGWSPVSSPTASGKISVDQFQSVRLGVLKFAVEDLLGKPLRRNVHTEQRRVYGSRGETFGFENVITVVFDYEVTGDPNRIARFVFQGRGTNPPLEDKSLLPR